MNLQLKITTVNKEIRVSFTVNLCENLFAAITIPRETIPGCLRRVSQASGKRTPSIWHIGSKPIAKMGKYHSLRFSCTYHSFQGPPFPHHVWPQKSSVFSMIQFCTLPIEVDNQSVSPFYRALRSLLITSSQFHIKNTKLQAVQPKSTRIISPGGGTAYFFF